MGHISNDDQNFLVTEHLKNNQNVLECGIKMKKDLKQLFNKSSPEVVDMLISLLQLNPKKRNTVEQCIKKQLFNQVRNSRLEQGSDICVKVEIDEQNEDNMYGDWKSTYSNLI